MNNAVEVVKGQSAAMADNVVEIHAGGVLSELDDQPLPVDAEVVVAEKLSIRVQVREARLASAELRRGDSEWSELDRWAGLVVILGAGLTAVAGLLALFA